MLSDQALQHAIAHSILYREGPDLAPALKAGAFDPLRRLNIYRNNTFASLTATLLAVFPVTTHLLGENYFRYVATVFIRTNPPEEARLVRYGSNFADFLAGLEDVRAMPFIVDTARLEWQIAEALDAPALPGCDASDLHCGDADTMPELVLQPSLRLLFCRWPALEIWSAHQPGGNLDRLTTIARRPERIALWRSSESIRFLRLNAPLYAFLYGLRKGRDLERAVSRALARAPEFDLAAAIGGLFADGLVARTRHTPSKFN
jgi:hypothetical protein